MTDKRLHHESRGGSHHHKRKRKRRRSRTKGNNIKPLKESVLLVTLLTGFMIALGFCLWMLVPPLMDYLSQSAKWQKEHTQRTSARFLCRQPSGQIPPLIRRRNTCELSGGLDFFEMVHETISLTSQYFPTKPCNAANAVFNFRNVEIRVKTHRDFSAVGSDPQYLIEQIGPRKRMHSSNPFLFHPHQVQ